MLIPVFIILTWVIILMGMGILLGYIIPIFQTRRAYQIAALVFLCAYAFLVWSELPIGLMVPFILATALCINFSRYLRRFVRQSIPIRMIAIATVFGSACLLVLYMGLSGRKFNYPEGESYKKMAQEGYSNLAGQNPIISLFTTHYHAKIYDVKDHCPIPDDGQNPNRDYVIATYEKAFGLTQRIIYHNCGYGKFWGGPEPEWELSKDKLVAGS